jgi:hypothetical protein
MLFFVFAPYVLLPLAVSLIFKWLRIRREWLTYFIVFLLILFYPLGLFWQADFFRPPPPPPSGVRCGIIETSLLFLEIILFAINALILLPVSLVLLNYFNKRSGIFKRSGITGNS